MTTEYAESTEIQPSTEPESTPSDDVESYPSHDDADGEIDEQDGQTQSEDADQGDSEPEPADPDALLQTALDKRQRAERGEDVQFSSREYQALGQHDRSEQSRRASYEHLEQQRQQGLQQLNNAHEGAAAYLEHVTQNFLKEVAGNVNLSQSQRTALRAQIYPAIQTLRGVSEQLGGTLIAESQRQSIREELTSQGHQLDPAQEHGLSQLGPGDLIEIQKQLARLEGIREGQSQAAGKDKVLVDRKEWERITKADSTAERAEQGGKAPPQRGGSRSPGTGGAISESQIRNASEEQIFAWLSDPKTEELVNKTLEKIG